ncbi:MAG: FAD-binding oxidoreductase [Candidatus Helarchaeota archaeon]|nr:FAD-binding oxidoreductase [Candidatus Helarchaeota archaeon]
MLVEDKDEILEGLSAIVGENYASNDDAIRIGYSRDQVLTTEGPDYVVAPESVKQIQEVMKFATKHKIPVIPKGTGANMGGLVIPLYGGIILDLKRINQIYEIDGKNMTAIVGPGVTYGQLQIEAWNRGMFVVVPSGPHSVKVIANVCGTRGIGHYAGKYALGDNQIIGMEIVLPNGNLLKLGSFAHGKEEDSANYPHGPGPDLMGLFLGGFGTVGVITKIKIKLYPKLRYHELLSIGGKLDILFDEVIKLVKMGYSNGMMVRWPYVVFLFAKSREEHFQWLKNQLIEGFILLFIEGTKRDFDYHVKKIKSMYKKRKDFTVGLYSELMDFMKPIVSKGATVTEDDQEYGYVQEPRKLHDFMYQSVRILRTHGGFAPHCPFFALKDAKATWNYMKKWITTIGAPLEETCCYLQLVDDGHSVLQEMDLEFDPDPNKMLDNVKTFIGIGKPMVDTMFVKMNGIQYYFYSNGEILETIGPILIPGYFYLLKQFKTLIDPHCLMNRGRGIRPETVKKEELQMPTSGDPLSGGFSMGSFFWLSTLASVINALKHPEPEILEKFINDVKDKKVGEEKLQEILEFALNTSINLILNDDTRATAGETLGEFFKRHYNKMIGKKIVIKSDFHNLWMIEFGNLENTNPIKVYTVDRKDARNIPSILTDFIFERKALVGEEVDPMLSMLKKGVGTFSITHAIAAWMKILEEFSNVVMIGTTAFLYQKKLMQQLNTQLNNKIDSILN